MEDDTVVTLGVVVLLFIVVAHGLFRYIGSNYRAGPKPRPVANTANISRVSIPGQTQQLIRTPTTQQYGFMIGLQQFPAFVDLKFEHTCFSDSDIRITLMPDQITAEQWNAGEWMRMGHAKITSGNANRLKLGDTLHVMMDYGEITVTNMATMKALLNAQPLVRRSTRAVGPLKWLLPTGAVYKETLAADTPSHNAYPTM